jgi:hypothetical protein
MESCAKQVCALQHLPLPAAWQMFLTLTSLVVLAALVVL